MRHCILILFLILSEQAVLADHEASRTSLVPMYDVAHMASESGCKAVPATSGFEGTVHTYYCTVVSRSNLKRFSRLGPNTNDQPTVYEHTTHAAEFGKP